MLDRVKHAYIWFIALLPTLLVTFYYGVVASDQYVSEAKFVVRSASRNNLPSSFLSMLQVAIGQSKDDSFAVQEYLTSRDAIRDLKKELPLQKYFERPNGDFLSRYPSVIYGKSEEEFFDYFKRMLTVSTSSSTGISVMRVSAFHPNDAYKIANDLLTLSERLINRINTRIHQDTVQTSAAELQRSQERLIDAQVALAKFRNQELLVDPTRNAVTLAELIAKLSSELATARAQLTEMLAAAAQSPQIATTRRKIAALEMQIAQERAKISAAPGQFLQNGADIGLAEKIAKYERLYAEREFASKMVTAAEADLSRARLEAQRQQLYLDRIVEPGVSDYSTEPERFRFIVTTLGFNLTLMLIVWLIWVGANEHAAERRL